MEKRRRQRMGARAKHRAASKDVLAGPPAATRVRPKWRTHYERLTDLLERMRREQGLLNQDALEESPNFSTHMADAGTDTYDRDLALGFLSSEQDAVYEIEEALTRIRDGNYGVCELTGKHIEPERLEAIPWTRFSAAAEKQLESEGELKRPRLGPRQTVAHVSPPAEQEES
jgi:RNA polymerase-binding transcription factor DksA